MADPLIRYRDTNREDPRDQGFNNNLGNNAGGPGGDRLAPSPGARSQHTGRGGAQASPPRPRTPPSDPEVPFLEKYAVQLKYFGIVLLAALLLFILRQGLLFFLSSRNTDGIQKSCIGKCLKNWEENNRLKATVQLSPESTPDVSGITANIQPWIDPDRRWSRADFLRDSQREIDNHISKDRKQTLGLGSQGSKNLLPAEDPEFWSNFGQRLSDLASSAKSLNQNKNQLSTSLLNKEYDRTYQSLQAEKKLIDTLRKNIEELLGLDDSPERIKIENDVTRIRDQIEELNRVNPSTPLEINYKQAREKSDQERINLQKKNAALANL